MAQGAFVISLDFELFWGMRDKRTIEGYGANILGVRQALPRMLDAFDAHGVKATFATVGLLFFDRKDDLMRSLPELKPGYTTRDLSPYNGHIDAIGADELNDPYHYGASLIHEIKNIPRTRSPATPSPTTTASRTARPKPNSLRTCGPR